MNLTQFLNLFQEKNDEEVRLYELFSKIDNNMSNILITSILLIFCIPIITIINVFPKWLPMLIVSSSFVLILFDRVKFKKFKLEKKIQKIECERKIVLLESYVFNEILLSLLKENKISEILYKKINDYKIKLLNITSLPKKINLIKEIINLLPKNG